MLEETINFANEYHNHNGYLLPQASYLLKCPAGYAICDCTALTETQLEELCAEGDIEDWMHDIGYVMVPNKEIALRLIKALNKAFDIKDDE